MVYRPIINCVELKEVFEMNGQMMQNTYYAQGDSAVTLGDLQALADKVIDWESPDALLDRSITCKLVQVIATDLTSLDSGRVVVTDGLPALGARLSEHLPHNVTLAIKGSTGQRGRGRSARTFWVGLCEDQIVGNNASPQTIVDLEDNMAALLAGINSVPGYLMSVAHRWRDNIKLDIGTTSPILSWGVTDTIVDSQKNRLPGHKKHRGGPVG